MAYLPSLLRLTLLALLLLQLTGFSLAQELVLRNRCKGFGDVTVTCRRLTDEAVAVEEYAVPYLSQTTMPVDVSPPSWLWNSSGCVVEGHGLKPLTVYNSWDEGDRNRCKHGCLLELRQKGLLWWDPLRREWISIRTF